MPVKPDPSRVAELFDAVVDLNLEEAGRLLSAECAGDVGLREAVERLVEQDRRAARGFLEPRPALLSSALREQRARAAAMAPRPVAHDELEVGGRIGRFVVVRKLGEGAMGVVYLCYDEVLDRRVALKLLRPRVATAGWLLREGRALGRLAHPNVVAVHEAGEHEGRVYLAMEFVEGRPLRAFLDEEARPFREVLALFIGAGRGLAAVHDAGLVHRDFKPENVLVGRDGRPRVLDFGIATLARRDAATNAASEQDAEGTRRDPGALEVSLLEPGAMAGTPAFMAPEQLRGKRATLASDQWSFSVALYRAVYGVPPFPVDGPFHALLRRVLEGEPEAPPRAPDVPAWLGPILLRGLAKDPAARFPSMHALLAAIERHLPRDPELDGSVVRRDLLILRLALLCAALVIFVIFSGALGRSEMRAKNLVLLSLWVLATACMLIALRWRGLSRNRFGRRAAGLFIGGTVAVFVHRIVAMRLGAPVPHILVGDMVVVATVFGTAAVAIERWCVVVAAIAMAGALLGAFVPDVAGAAFMATSFLALSLLTFQALRPQ